MKQTSQTAPPRVRRAQVLSLALLVLSGIVNYMDRGTLSVANQSIRNELGVSLSQMVWLLSAFAWSYALAQLPVGGLVDRHGPCKLLGLGLVLWSFAQAAGGLVTSFGQFGVSRVVLGVGDAPQFTSAARVVSNCFPVQERGKPTGVFNAASACSWTLATAAAPPNRVASLGSLQNFGGFLGGALAPILTGYIAQSYSFEPALLTGAAIAFLGALSYLFLVRTPIPPDSAASVLPVVAPAG
jgi:MFS family permease